MKKSLVIKNQKGQLIIEAVLLMTVLTSLMILASNILQSQGYVKSLVATPWQTLAGMIESGNWETADKARPLHPNMKFRNVTVTESSK